MKKILIVDDSALMRRVMSDIINKEPDMCAEDTAENGLRALELLEKKHYELILLDIQMPKMNGIAFLRAMIEKGIRIPVLIVSSIAGRDTKETIEALELGAYDFVKKPDSVTKKMMEKFDRKLLEKVYFAFEYNLSLRPETKEGEKLNEGLLKLAGAKRNWNTTKFCFIASSTGGPKALQSVIPKFPEKFDYPIVIVQHMPEGFTASLAERLDEMSACHVVEAEDGAILENSTVYVARGGYQLQLAQAGKGKHKFIVRRDEPRNGLRPCADIFLESLLDSTYERFCCAVLTGMGSDGTAGIRQLKKMKNVYTVGQSKETCVVYGMPQTAFKSGLVDEEADLHRITDIIVKKLI